MELIEAVLNIDLDFFTEPAFIGNHYLSAEPSSQSDFFAKAKIWLTIDDFLQKIGLKDRTRGCFVSDDKQILFYYQKLFDEEYLQPKKLLFVNVDAHHDMYDFFPEGYYDHISLFEYNTYNSLIAPIKHDWFRSPIVWIHPDYVTDEKMLDTSHVDISVEEVAWSNYHETFDWKYVSVILNKRMAKVENGMIDKLRSLVSEW